MEQAFDMGTRVHITVMGHRVEYEDPPLKVAKFLERLENMAGDPRVHEREMIGFAYSTENPFLEHGLFPDRGGVTREVLANPLYTVMTDLIFRKRIALAKVDIEKVAAKYSMTVAEAAAALGVHESAIRQAIGAKRLSSFVKDGRHYIDPRALATLEVGTRGPKARGGPLEIVMGHTKGASFKVKSPALEDVTRVENNILRGRLTKWRRIIVMTTGEGGSTRAVVLDPDTSENEYKFGPFYVRGRFKIAAKSNTPKSAQQLWDAYEVE